MVVVFNADGSEVPHPGSRRQHSVKTQDGADRWEHQVGKAASHAMRVCHA